MPSVKLSPVFNDAQLDNNGLPLSGGQVYWYIAGTTTPISVYSENTGSTVQTNPVILNVRGEPDQPIWLVTNSNYKAILTDSVGNIIRQIDNIAGINDMTTPTISEWVLSASIATYVGATSFSVTGDQTAIFTTQRRIKATVSGGQSYSTISTSTYSLGITTVVVVNDSTVLDTGLSAVYYGFLDPSHPSFDSTGINAATKSAFQNQSFTAWTTAGTSTAYTLTPTPSITSLVANQRFRVKFNAASTGTPTLAISGLTAATLKQYDATGALVTATMGLNQLTDVEYNGTVFVVLDPLLQTAGDARYAKLAGLNTQVFSVANGASGNDAVNFGQAIALRTANVTPVNIGTGQLTSALHSLGVIPAFVQLEYVCLTAEQGYSVGDVVVTTAQWNGGVSSPQPFFKTTSDMGIRCSAGFVIMLTHKTTGVAFTPTAANWAYRFSYR